MFGMLEFGGNPLAHIAAWLIVGFAVAAFWLRDTIIPALLAPLVTYNVIDGETSYPARHRHREEGALT